MFKNLIQEIKKGLEEQKKKIGEQFKKLTRQSKKTESDYEVKFPHYGEKEDENAEEVSAFSDQLSLSENLKNSLDEINFALKKIEKGSYGICEKCGTKIEEKRLKAFPTARYCLSCKTKNKF